MNNPFVKALAGYQSWGAGSEVLYYFDSGISRPFSAAEKANFRLAAEAWAHVANVILKETHDVGLASISESVVDAKTFHFINGPDAIALHQFPNDIITFGDYADPDGLKLPVFVHELGHALGLAHPHDHGQHTSLFPGVIKSSDLGAYEFNQDVYTVMSYNHYNVPVVGPMAFDIAAIQSLYGANTSYHSGDNTYKLDGFTGGYAHYLCIWDTSGNDTISFGGAAGVHLDLRPATLRVAPGGGGYFSGQFQSAGGLSIANGVVIENATGGSGNDELIGNNANNTLMGGGGNDFLVGGLGKDELDGGAGRDTFQFNHLSESGTDEASRDVIGDFSHGRDRIDVHGIDARKGSGNDTFHWIGSANFHNVKGDLHEVKIPAAGPAHDITLVEGDVNGDGLADFQIELRGLINLTKGDFVL